MIKTIHVGDVGTIFEQKIVNPKSYTIVEGDKVYDSINISTATVIKFYFQKPDETRFARNGELKTDGTDGIIQYIAINGEIDIAGSWSIQCYVELSDGKFFAAKDNFVVKSTLYTDLKQTTPTD